jgi:hypothetical protein
MGIAIQSMPKLLDYHDRATLPKHKPGSLEVEWP